jgi:hypothetical protein
MLPGLRPSNLVQEYSVLTYPSKMHQEGDSQANGPSMYPSFYIGKETSLMQTNHAIGISYPSEGALGPTLKALPATALGSRTRTLAWC